MLLMAIVDALCPEFRSTVGAKGDVCTHSPDALQVTKRTVSDSHFGGTGSTEHVSVQSGMSFDSSLLVNPSVGKSKSLLAQISRNDKRTESRIAAF